MKPVGFTGKQVGNRTAVKNVALQGCEALMISSISLKFGKSSASEPLIFDPGAITVFVGPNNSGKSLVLREIESFLKNGSPLETHLIVDGIEVGNLDKGFVEQQWKTKIQHQDESSGVYVGYEDLVSGEAAGLGFWEKPENIVEKIINSPVNLRKFASLFTTRLDGATRLSIIKDRESSSLRKPPKNTHVAILRRRNVRDQLRDIVYNAFSEYVVLDTTEPSKIVIKLSKVEPSEIHETSYGEDALNFHESTKLLTEQGDGIKAFTGILLAILCSGQEIQLIDEPEAFLHPPLAYKLGNELAKLAVPNDTNLIVATHSASFLLGCLASGKSVNIVRLTYKGGVPTAKMLSASEVLKLVRNPYVRSAGVLSAIFHDGAVVAENDTDRVFYQEINSRLEREGRSFAKDSHFINVNGNTGEHRVIGPLRQLGVPAAAIVDFDTINNGSLLSELYSACNIPESARDGLRSQRSRISQIISNAVIAGSGLNDVPTENRSEVEDFIDRLSEFGIFIVPYGALESWLPDLNISGPKKAWLDNVFTAIGENPEDENYLKPQQGDVWDFMSKIGTWIANPNRKGMPI